MTASRLRYWSRSHPGELCIATERGVPESVAQHDDGRSDLVAFLDQTAAERRPRAEYLEVGRGHGETRDLPLVAVDHDGHRRPLERGWRERLDLIAHRAERGVRHGRAQAGVV